MISKEEACKLADKRMVKEVIKPFGDKIKENCKKEILGEVLGIFASGAIKGAELMYDVIAKAEKDMEQAELKERVLEAVKLGIAIAILEEGNNNK